MSSSFLKPSVTPATALATRLRASPWNLRSSPSSRSSDATSDPLSCAKTIPGGTGWRSFPFGPCTSTASPAIFTVTPFGIGIGFLPIRDITEFPVGPRPKACGPRGLRPSSPYVAEHFAAHARLAGGPARHHAARGRQNAGAEAAEHRRHVLDAEVDATAGAADALEPADHALAVRAVLQEQPDHRPRLLPGLLGRSLHHAEALDVALILQDPRDFRLQLAGGQIDARVLGDHRVADARDHVGNRISHLLFSLNFQLPTSNSQSWAWRSGSGEFSSTRNSSSRPSHRLRAPACGSTGGTCRTCACTPAAGRTGGSGCGDGS